MSKRCVGPGGDPGGRRRTVAVPAAGRVAAHARSAIYDEGADVLRRSRATSSPRYQALHVRCPARQPVLGRPARRSRRTGRSTRADPRDAGVQLDAVRPHVVQYAAKYGIKLLFSITGTPRWANGGAELEPAAARTSRTCAGFAYAAAARVQRHYVGDDGRTLPAVRLWAAWNEPNNPVFLRPQFVKQGGKWVVQSAIAYAKICNAVYDGRPRDAVQGRAGRVRRHRAAREQQPGELAAVGLARRVPDGGEEGRDEDLRRVRAQPVLRRADRDADDAAAGHAVRRAADRDHARQHQRADRGRRRTSTGPGRSGSPSTATRRIRPTRCFGVSWAKQARYLTQAFAIARKNPRIDADALVPAPRRADRSRAGSQG